MKIIFHPHAIEKLAKRNLDKSVVEEGINNPDRVLDGKHGEDGLYPTCAPQEMPGHGLGRAYGQLKRMVSK